MIVGRALPDVRDGLKPSQRRILVALGDLKLRPSAKYRKCANIAGHTARKLRCHRSRKSLRRREQKEEG